MLRIFRAALDDADVVFGKSGADHFAHNRCRVRRHFRGLQDGRVARRDRSHQRHHQQLKRIVPRRDDERYAVRFLVNVTLGRHHEHGRMNFLARLPVAHAGNGDFDFVVYAKDFGRVSIRLPLAQVGVYGGENVLFVRGNCVLEFFEGIDAKSDVARFSRPEKFLLFLKQGIDGCFVHGRSRAGPPADRTLLFSFCGLTISAARRSVKANAFPPRRGQKRQAM